MIRKNEKQKHEKKTTYVRTYVDVSKSQASFTWNGLMPTVSKRYRESPPRNSLLALSEWLELRPWAFSPRETLVTYPLSIIPWPTWALMGGGPCAARDRKKQQQQQQRQRRERWIFDKETKTPPHSQIKNEKTKPYAGCGTFMFSLPLKKKETWKKKGPRTYWYISYSRKLLRWRIITWRLVFVELLHVVL